MRNTINRTTSFNKCKCNLTPEVRNILKILWKRQEIGAISPLSAIFCYLFLDFYVDTGSSISLRDKRLFEISEIEITRVDCICLTCIFFIFQTVDCKVGNETYKTGESYPAGDGCNWCVCYNGLSGCTLMACLRKYCLIERVQKKSYLVRFVPLVRLLE